MLKQRVLTALVLLPVALAGFFWLEGGAFALFIAFVVVLGAWEWARLAGINASEGRIAYAAMVALALLVLYLFPALGQIVLVAGVLWWGSATLLVLSYPDTARYWEGRTVRKIIGFLVLLPAWQGLVMLKHWPEANSLIVGVMVLVWAADIGAYFAGRRYGKRKLAPQVSPGKSWEGFYGGMLVSLFITLLVAIWRDWSFSVTLLALLGAALVVAISVVGDLTESMFKRQAGMKDSSNLLPGHGGVMDRIDSLTAAVPVYTMLLLVSGAGAL
ncbi:phosphatidate cytidylyltransferase [Pseudomonas matsuisoli]|uniref:Phosphatidate cytidylyltransferase n=1 Tax=Pseudomonas matsuisoli TaxID=1515666 RepID=A0A917PK03_9PSED|nr:phosphatidate cytidylyltransferase [Pseudomonas matsuisoli]GGJ81912.1 phosphatidate cytidylyltransferase [Pseudomonas matsuisoli]